MYPQSNEHDENHEFKFLYPDQIKMIEEALLSLDGAGEVRLIVEKGRLRFLVTQKSFETEFDDPQEAP